jgi:transcriptional regulator with XRE-family HTH domain
LSDLENGTKNPSLDTVEKIATAFGLTSSDLLQKTDNPEDLVSSAKDSSSELLAGLSKSGDLIKVLYRAKDAPKETMDQMAIFLDTLLKTQEQKSENEK